MRRLRGPFHVIALSGLLGLSVTVSAGGARPWLLLAWAAVYGVAALAIELGLRRVDAQSRRIFTSADNDGVRPVVGPTRALLEAADSVDILSGTLKTFVEHNAAIRALHDRYRARTQVRILLMEPGNWGSRLAVEERRARGATTPDDREILDTLQRLADEFSPAVLCDVVRFYPTSRRASVHRYGDRYIVTLYTFGRGASSPTPTLRRQGHEAFCGALDQGFAELWNAGTTQRLNAALRWGPWGALPWGTDVGAVARSPPSAERGVVSPSADTLKSDDLPAADDDRMVVQVHRRPNVAGQHGKQVAVVDT